MPQISQSRVTAFRQARDTLITLLEQQASFLRHDIDSRSYVVPCLALQIPQQLDIVADSAIKMALESRHHPYVLVHQPGYHETTVPMHCAALKGQCIHLATRLRNNLCTDIPISVAGLIDHIVANLPF